MADSTRSNSAAVRAADALLRGVGGRKVIVRIPQPAVPADPTEQLGLATPLFQDAELYPVVFRRVRPTISAAGDLQYELLVSATAVEAVTGSQTLQSASVLFTTALGVLVDEVLLQIESIASSEIFGTVYLYRLGLRAPATSKL